jgi:acetoin utilization deacetylase AcuC-like enzyme
MPSTALRRTWTSLRRLLLPHRMDPVYSPACAVRIDGVQFDPERGERILTFLLAEGLVGWRRVLRPEPASVSDLLSVHTKGYLESLHHAEGFIPILGFPLNDDLRERVLAAQRTQVGGTVLAARHALAHRRIAAHLSGGLHHARPEAGGGYCVYNDVAVAIVALRNDGFTEPVLVIDLDLHDGNGTRAAFARDPTVFTFSIHNRDWDPVEAVASKSVVLAGEVDDRRYLETLRAELPPVIEAFRPGMVFYVAGTDVAVDDKLGNWQLSDAGVLDRDRLVLESFGGRHPELPLVITLAGGYGHLAWRYTARLLGWLAAGRVIEPPSTEEVTLLGYRRRIRNLDAAQLEAAGADSDWGLTEADVLGSFGPSTHRTRFLGHYSRQAVELLLETSSFYESLRALGFAHPTLDMDLDNPAGETLRLFSSSDRSELLMEVRVRRDSRTVPGMELLRLEWLLLQNPRQEFSDDRRPLPGQSHPGLGLLADIMSILVLITERLELAGILFVPSHYHLGSKGRRFLRFLDPDDEGRLRAIERAVGHLGLAEATNAVADGRLLDRASGEPVEWRPASMVVPTTQRLRDRVHSDDYEQAAAEAAERYDFTLASE